MFNRGLLDDTQFHNSVLSVDDEPIPYFQQYSTRPPTVTMVEISGGVEADGEDRPTSGVSLDSAGGVPVSGKGTPTAVPVQSSPVERPSSKAASQVSVPSKTSQASLQRASSVHSRASLSDKQSQHSQQKAPSGGDAAAATSPVSRVSDVPPVQIGSERLSPVSAEVRAATGSAASVDHPTSSVSILFCKTYLKKNTYQSVFVDSVFSNINCTLQLCSRL